MKYENVRMQQKFSTCRRKVLFSCLSYFVSVLIFFFQKKRSDWKYCKPTSQTTAISELQLILISGRIESEKMIRLLA